MSRREQHDLELQRRATAAVLGLHEARFEPTTDVVPAAEGNAMGDAGQNLTPGQLARFGGNPSMRANQEHLAFRIAQGPRAVDFAYAIEQCGMSYWLDPELRAAVRSGKGIEQFLD